MKNKTLLAIVIGVVLLIVVIGCCMIAALVIIPSVFPSKPDHYGVFLREGKSFVEMRPFAGAPSSGDIAGIPVTSDSNPTIILWDPTINLRYLNLRNMTSRRKTVDFAATPSSGDMLEAKPATSLSPDLYCFVQGDPLGVPGQLTHWCFRVE